MRSRALFFAAAIAAALAQNGRAAESEADAASSAQCLQAAANLTPLPSVTPQNPPGERPYYRLSWDDPALNLGQGHIRPENADRHVPGWHQAIRLPLYAGPNGKQVGWLANGWRIALSNGGTTIEPLDTHGMIETGYETPSFIALQVQDDGWMQIRVDVEKEGHDGTAWLHRCHLMAGDNPLVFEPWGQRFMVSEVAGALFFRDRDRHILRSGPGAAHARVGAAPEQLADNYHLEPVEVDGPWMRVRVKEPSDFCGEPAAGDAPPAEGWIQWWSEEQGPWVWYHTRGC